MNSESITYSEHRFNESTIHLLKIKKKSVRLKLVLGKDSLSSILKKERAVFGINAGFFDIDTLLPFLGFLNYQSKTPIIPGLPFINFSDNSVNISKTSSDTFLQAGPLLLKDSAKAFDLEYFRKNKHLFDCYIDETPNPRSAFGYDKDYYYFIAVDGRSENSKGLFIEELADFLKSLNISDAINLDGGSSTTLIYKDKVLNNLSGNSKIPKGIERKISSAILGFLID